MSARAWAIFIGELLVILSLAAWAGWPTPQKSQKLRKDGGEALLSGFELAQRFNDRTSPTGNTTEGSEYSWRDVMSLDRNEFENFIQYVDFDGREPGEIQGFIERLGFDSYIERMQGINSGRADYYFDLVEQNAVSNTELAALNAGARHFYSAAIVGEDIEFLSRLKGILPPMDQVQKDSGRSVLMDLVEYSGIQGFDYVERIFEWNPELDWNLTNESGDSAATILAFSGGGAALLELTDRGLSVNTCTPKKKLYSADQIWVAMEEIQRGHTARQRENRTRKGGENPYLDLMIDKVENEMAVVFQERSSQISRDPVTQRRIYDLVPSLRQRTPDIFKGWCISEFLKEFDPPMAELFDEATTTPIDRSSGALGAVPEGPCTEAFLKSYLRLIAPEVQRARLSGKGSIKYFDSVKCPMLLVNIKEGGIQVDFPNDFRSGRELRPIVERYLQIRSNLSMAKDLDSKDKDSSR